MPWPYGFYTVLRLTVCGSAVCMAVLAYRMRKTLWVWLMGATGILFNPLVPVYMRRSDWLPLDFLAAALFVASVAAIHYSKKTKPRAQG